MVRPSAEGPARPLTDAESIAIGDGTDVGEDGVDLDNGGGTAGPGTSTPTPPAAEVIQFVPVSGSAVEIDFNVANWWDITLTDDCDLSIVNPPASGTLGRLGIILRQGAGAPYTVTWPDGVQWPASDGTPGGTPVVLWTTEGARDVIRLITEDGGATYGPEFDDHSTSPASDHVETVTDAGSALELDYAVARIWDITLTQNCTLTIANPPEAGTAGVLSVIIRQGGSGGYTVTWPSEVVWQDPTDGGDDGAAPTLWTSVGAQDDIELASVDGGTTWGGTHLSAAGASALTVADEGSPLATAASTLDFVGAGVTASGTGATKTITIPGGSDPADDTAAWMPLTTVVDGDPVLVWDGDDSLIPTLVPL